MHDVPLMQSPPDAEVEIDGQRYVYFGGTSYLGLHARPEPREAACEATKTLGLHAATSRSGFGNTAPLLDLEREAAGFFGTDDALCLPSGYLAAAALLKTVGGNFTDVFIDGGAHYAVADAARLVGVGARYFEANDAADLDRALSELPADARPLVLSDGLSPMGRIAPLRDYVRLLEAFVGAGLVVDDAHGFGTLGEIGRGTVEHFGLAAAVNRAEPPADRVAIYAGGTLSKAMGGFGGVIAGEEAFVDRLRRYSQLFTGASGLPSGVAAASASSLRILRKEGPELRARLRRNVTHLRQGLAEMGLAVATDSPAPVVAVEAGSARHMQMLHEDLRADGILLPYVPTYSGLGPAGALRLAVFATHTPAMIDRLLDNLRGRV